MAGLIRVSTARGQTVAVDITFAWRHHRLDDMHDLLRRISGQGPIPCVHGIVRSQAHDLIITLHRGSDCSGVGRYRYRALKVLGFSAGGSPRRRPAADAAPWPRSKEAFPTHRGSTPTLPPDHAVEVWFQDRDTVSVRRSNFPYRARPERLASSSRPRSTHARSTLPISTVFPSAEPRLPSSARFRTPSHAAYHLDESPNEGHQRTHHSHY